MGVLNLNRVCLVFLISTFLFLYSSGGPPITDVRLVNGSSNAEGRVEVWYVGSWMRVCGEYYRDWNLITARVVCRTLGFDGALEATRSARFGQGTGDGPVLALSCRGTEKILADCTSWLSVSCRHDRYVGATCYSGAHPNPFQVRLIGGSNDAEGRVEVMNDGSWGTICDSGWDLRDAKVVCRMLGFDGALDAPRSARFGQGSGRILLSHVGCDGKEDNLVYCAYRVFGDRYCYHGEDAGAICYRGAHPNPFQARLVDGSNDAEGRVEVMYDGSWGTICDDGWDLRDARVVCRMLGFDGTLDAPRSARFGRGSGRVLLAGVTCDGREDNLAYCYHHKFRYYTYSYCSHARDSGAICYIGEHPNPSQVRLVNGSNDAEGRVEVMYDGSWGTICDDGWDLRNARVVCRMLGYDGALDAPGSARFGQGSGRILLDDVGCIGIEYNLADCAHRGIEVHDCRHSEDAGARCNPGDLTTSVDFETTGLPQRITSLALSTVEDTSNSN